MIQGKKVLLLWYTIDENFGDVLIYQTVKNELEKKKIQVGYMDVGEFCINIFEEANNYDFLLFAGGGIIERNPPNVVICFKKYHHILKVPYGIVGIGVGCFDYSEYLDSISYWIKNADFFYTRDEYSAERLKQLCGIDSIKHEVDVVWANESIIALNRKKNLKGINIRDVPYLDIWPDMDWEMLRNIIYKTGYVYEVSDQSNQIYKKKMNIYNRNHYDNKLVLNQIWNCKTLIAMRYHVVLVATANNTPVIPIIYCPKVECLAKQIGIKEYSIGVDEINSLANKIEQLYYNQVTIREIMENSYRRMNQQAKDLLDEISTYILNKDK